MSEDTADRELEAMQSIIRAMSGLENGAKGRVMRYVVERLDIQLPPTKVAPKADSDGVASFLGHSVDESVANPAKPVADIRSLVAAKRPRSAIEMAALVAYYLAEVAPASQKTVSVKDLEKYFKQGAYPLPKVPRFTLTNAKEAGFLEATSRGEYKLTPVGHNLVTHEMPTRGGGEVTNSKRTK